MELLYRTCEAQKVRLIYLGFIQLADCILVPCEKSAPICLCKFHIPCAQSKTQLRTCRHQRTEEKRQKDAEREKLAAERDAARLANAQAKARLASLQHDIDVIRKRIATKEEGIAKAREERDLQKKQAMALNCFDVKTQGVIAILKEYTDRLVAIAQSLTASSERYLHSHTLKPF